MISTPRKIALIGFMAVGKTTIGRALGPLLSLPFVDLDQEVLHLSRFSSVADVFSAGGEPLFRTLEQQALRRVADLDRILLATGGGTILSTGNILTLKNSGFFIVHLRAPLAVVRQRIEDPLTRPLANKIEELYSARLPLYERLADIEFSTDVGHPLDVALDLVKMFKQLSEPESGLRPTFTNS